MRYRGIIWKPKGGPIFTPSRSAHFAWGGWITSIGALLGPQYVWWFAFGAVLIGFLWEVFSFVTFEDDPHPYGDGIDFLAWIPSAFSVGLGVALKMHY